MIVIAITMFQIQCHSVCVCHQRGMAGCLSGGERRQGGVLLLDVQEAGQWEVCGGAELRKEGQSRVQVKKRRSECLPELLGTDRGLPGFLNTSDEE